MSKPDRFRVLPGCILAVFSLVGCGGSSDQPDAFHGVVTFQDLSNPQIDSKFLSQSCTASSSGPACRSANSVSGGYACPNYVYNCYNPQEGHAKGKAFYFYNFLSLSAGISPVQICDPTPSKTTCSGGTVRTNIPVSAIEPTPVGGGGAHVDNNFLADPCEPGRTYNEQLDNYATTSQYPIFNNLPFALTANQVLDGDFDYPIAATYDVTLSATETCNDLKDSRSIGDSGTLGDYGATRSAQPTGYRLMGPVDIAVSTVPVYASNGLLLSQPPFAPIPGNSSYGPLYGWFKGLLLRYLDGGPIPTTTATDTLTGASYTAFAAMDGVILDPTTGFADPGDQNAILLPYTPGDASYSPIVRLHDYHLPAGVSGTSLTSICLPTDPQPCPASSVDYTKVTAAPKWMIFIAAPAQ